MKKFLLLALLIGLPSPLFAGSSTSGYKPMESCKGKEDEGEIQLWKEEDTNSKKWGVRTCDGNSYCSWANKAVSYDTAVDKYNEKSSDKPCTSGTLSIDD